MHKLKMWRNSPEVQEKRLPTINDRTWTRRIQWLEDSPTSDVVKLKMEDGEVYKEVGVSRFQADGVWHRFKDGQSIEDCLSFFAVRTPSPSRRAEQ
jgi:hypothetical protein